MSDEQIKGAIRGFIRAMSARDWNQASSFLTGDAVWTGPGTDLRSQADIVAYGNRLAKVIPELKVTENGMGITVSGNVGVIEHDLSGTANGKKWAVPATCIYEFKGDKIQNIRTFYDRLNQAQQGAKGWFQKMAVNAIVGNMEKPLR